MHRRLFFLHIPKCGGSSLDAAIDTWLDSTMPGRTSSYRLDSRELLKAAEMAGIDEDTLSERLLFDVLAQPEVPYVSGHFRFSPAARKAFDKDWDFITLLRDPVARFFSHYFYNRWKDESDGHYRIDDELEDFVHSPRGSRLAHTLLLRLTDRTFEEALADPQACAAQAIANLQTFALVGCLEHLDAFVSRFDELYGARLEMPRHRVNPVSPELQAQHVSVALRERVEEMCQADRAIYEHARGFGDLVKS